MADVSARGRFVWYDLMTSEPKKVEPFYKTVAGWGTQAWDGATPYTMWTVGGTPMAGVMDLPPNAGAPPHWLGYVAVPDVDLTTEQAQSLGGTVMMKPRDIPAVGRFSVLADPQGAVFATFSPSGGVPRETGAPALGEFSWHELMTTDNAAAFRFYETIFGWDTIQEHDMGPMGVYLIFGRNGAQMGGMFNKPPQVTAPPNWLHYIRVESADRTAEVVTANGGTILNGPMEVPGGDRIAQCLDPLGAAFAVHSVGK